MRRTVLHVRLILPRNFLTALGQLIAQWSFMEDAFDHTISMLRFKPEAQSLSPVVWDAFGKRMDLFMRSAKVCFGDSPALLQRCQRIRQSLGPLKTFRDLAMHGRWGLNTMTGRITVHSLQKGTLRTETVTIERLRKACHDISALAAELMHFRFWYLRYPAGPQPLTSDEKGALRKFLNDYSPKLPTPQAPSLPQRSSRG